MNSSDDDKVRDLDINGHEEVSELRGNPSGGLATRGDAAFIAEKQQIDIVDEVLNRVAEDDVMAISQSCLQLRSRTGLRLVGILLVMGVNQAAYGVDWAVMGNINAYDTWHNYFGFGYTGAILATINALMLIGSVCGAPFLVLSDVYGRRSVNFLGNALSIIAAIMQSQAPNLPVFMVGRFILGFGTALCTSSQYMAEISPVHLRVSLWLVCKRNDTDHQGRMVGIFGACFQIGSVLMGGAMVGFSRWTTSNWQWRLPILLQCVGPLFVCSSIYFLCPETPRFLIMKGRYDEARAVIAKTMTTNNDVNAPIVAIVFRQIEESLESATAGTKTLRAAWDFRVFFTRRVAFRTTVIVVYSW